MTALAITGPWRTAERLRDPAQALWSELRFAREPVDELDLLVAAVDHCEDARPTRGATLKLLETLLGRWVGARLVIAEVGKPPRYSLERSFLSMASPPAIPAPSRKSPFPRRTDRQRLWSAMRVLRNFDLPTLTIAAQANPRTARNMISVLQRGGWLRQTSTGWSTLGGRQWGPIAPSWSRIDGPDGSVIRVADHRDGSLIELPVRPQRGRVPRRNSSAARLSDGGVG